MTQGNGSAAEVPSAVEESAFVEPAPPPPIEWPGFCLGHISGNPVSAQPENSCLVLGPPRSGKTSCFVVQNVLYSPAAAVSTSTKTEVLELTKPNRAYRGTCWVFDPGGSLEEIPGTRPLRWSPVSGCDEWNTADSTAHALIAATRSDRDFLDSTYWRERAQALLAPLLHAAALVGLDIGWVLRWVLRRDVREAEAAVSTYGHPMAADVLAGIMGAEERERSGVFSTAANVLAAYRSPEAIEAAKEPNFDPWSFARSSDTVYICASGAEQDQLASLVVGLLEQIKRAVYTRPRGWPPVTWILDELANIAPLPDLPKVVSEGAGQGLVILACLQDLSQARSRWGVAGEGFLSLFRQKIILPGIADGRTLELVSQLAGEVDVRLRSVSRPSRWDFGKGFTTVNWSVRRQRRLPVDEVSRGHPGHALFVPAGQAPGWVTLMPWWGPPLGIRPDGTMAPRPA